MDIEYRTAPAGVTTKRFVQELITSAIVVGGGCIACSIVLLFVVPKFREIFKDFRTSLPTLTERILTLSDWYGSSWGWCLTLPLLVVMVVGVAVISAMNPTAGRWLRRGFLLAFVLVMSVTVMAILLPLMKLISSVSGGAP